jgi:hypothetical protein
LQGWIQTIGKWGEMTQTSYAHMNKINKFIYLFIKLILKKKKKKKHDHPDQLGLQS